MASGRLLGARVWAVGTPQLRAFTSLPRRQFSSVAVASDPSLPEAHKLVKGGDCLSTPRVGAIGKKLGMMGVWNAYGVREVLTVVQLEDCQVTQVKKRLSGRGTPRVNLQVGGGLVNPKKVSKAQLVHFRKAGVSPKKKVVEFRVDLDAVLPVGTSINVDHFRAGQMIDIQGVSKGKGFQGVMKRFGFKGGNATHGASKAHRQMGSTGQCQSPGKVWKGKKMPGRMGGNKSLQRNSQIYKIDNEKNLLFVRGSLPGSAGGFLKIKDARLPQKQGKVATLPFPTQIAVDGEEQVDEIVMDISNEDDPFD